MVVYTVPVGVDDEREVGLGELSVTVGKKGACVGGDAVARDGHGIEHTLTDDGAIGIRGRAGVQQEPEEDC